MSPGGLRSVILISINANVVFGCKLDIQTLYVIVFGCLLPLNIKISRLSKETNKHSGEKSCVSFTPNLVAFTVLKKPINLKSPIALKRNIIAIIKLPYQK